MTGSISVINAGPMGPAGPSGGGTALTDGDKGDIVVSSTGTVWNLQDDSVTAAKILAGAVTNVELANMAQATVKGRAVSAGTGPPTDLTATQLIAMVASVLRTRELYYSIPGVLAAGGGTIRVPFPRAATLTNVAVTVGTAPTGAAIRVDVNKNGTTIFTTQGNRPEIAVSTNADNTSVPDVTVMAANDYLTFDIDIVGSTVAGADLTVRVDYTETG